MTLVDALCRALVPLVCPRVPRHEGPALASTRAGPSVWVDVSADLAPREEVKEDVGDEVADGAAVDRGDVEGDHRHPGHRQAHGEVLRQEVLTGQAEGPATVDLIEVGPPVADGIGLGYGSRVAEWPARRRAASTRSTGAPQRAQERARDSVLPQRGSGPSPPRPGRPRGRRGAHGGGRPGLVRRPRPHGGGRLRHQTGRRGRRAAACPDPVPVPSCSRGPTQCGTWTATGRGVSDTPS